MENVDKVIDILCKTICEKNEQMSNLELIGLSKTLADLVVAKSQVKQLETNEMAFQICSKFLKQTEDSKSGWTNVRQDISDKKRNKPSIEVDIKVDRAELDEAIEKANQLVSFALALL